MLRNIFFHKNLVGENSPPSRFLKEKRWSAKSDVSKVLFPHIGKITNHSKHATLSTHFAIFSLRNRRARDVL